MAEGLLPIDDADIAHQIVADVSPADPGDEEDPAIENSDGRLWLALGGVAVAAGALLCVGLLLKPQPAAAIPSFAMQTGQPCSACHTAFPELTPFGREFKLSGYTAGGGIPITTAPPLAVMIQGPQFEHFDKNLDAAPTLDTHTNNNVVLNQASLFYGG